MGIKGRALLELSYTSWLAEMNQEDYVCGSLQFSIRPKAGWVVWNMPFETSQIVSWAPILHTPLPFNPHEGAPPVTDRRFLEVWFGPKIHFVQSIYGPLLSKSLSGEIMLDCIVFSA